MSCDRKQGPPPFPSWDQEEPAGHESVPSPPAYRVVLEFAVVQVDDVSADAVQEVLGMRDQNKDALEPVTKRPEVTSPSRPKDPTLLQDGKSHPPEFPDSRFQLLLQPDAGIQVEVVGGLIQKQHEGPDEEGPAENVPSGKRERRRGRPARGSRSGGGGPWHQTHLASATRIRQPPLKSFRLFLCMAGVKPRPCRMREARASALSASSSSNRSYSSISFSHSAVGRGGGGGRAL